MVNTIDNEEFQRLGLTPLQGAVLVTLLKLGGEGSAPEIYSVLSEEQKVNRTSIYTTLTKLESIGLLILTEGNPIHYSLITTSPDKLIRLILEPQKQIASKFRQQLNKAKESQSQKQDHQVFYLKDQEKIETQIDLAINQAEKYILIIATANVLEQIIDKLVDKHKNKVTILVMPTWNPGKATDLDNLFQRYRDLINDKQITKPLPIFTRLVPMMENIFTKNNIFLRDVTSKTHFIQILTEKELLLANYIDEESIGSGIYSREPMISIMLHIIYLSLFEQISSKPVQDITDMILEHKYTISTSTIQQLLQ